MIISTETIYQLAAMWKLIDAYPEITSMAAARIYDWLDNKTPTLGDPKWNEMTRYEQAQRLISWFEARIAEKR